MITVLFFGGGTGHMDMTSLQFRLDFNSGFPPQTVSTDTDCKTASCFQCSCQLQSSTFTPENDQCKKISNGQMGSNYAIQIQQAQSNPGHKLVFYWKHLSMSDSSLYKYTDPIRYSPGRSNSGEDTLPHSLFLGQYRLKYKKNLNKKTQLKLYTSQLNSHLIVRL